jgi:hypothetical protein
MFARIPGGWASEPPEVCKSVIPDQTPVDVLTKRPDVEQMKKQKKKFFITD